MSDEQPNEPAKAPVDDSPSRGDIAALGIGCLVTILLIGGALYYGFASS
jgi:hypothetical protein